MFKKISLAVAASSVLFIGNAQAAFDTYLKIDGISSSSGSAIPGLSEYMEIYSFSLGFTKGYCSALSVMKRMDTSSGEITAATLLGTEFTRAVLVTRQLGEQSYISMRMTLTNLVITSIQESGSAGGADAPTESVSLQPASVKIEAFSPNGSLLAINSVTCQKTK